MKKQRGITLIALIITIIVMLIMVGVTVNVALTGGLFDTAREARKKHEKAVIDEKVNSMITAVAGDIMSNPDSYRFLYDSDDATRDMGAKLFESLSNSGFEINAFTKQYTYIDEEGNEITKEYIDLVEMSEAGSEYFEYDEDSEQLTFKLPIEYEGFQYKLEIEAVDEPDCIKIGNLKIINETIITIIQKGDTPILVAGGNIKALTEEGVPIPKGFYYVTGTKNTGVVISDSQDDENNEDGNNGNQFVWVPVEVNPRIEIKITSNKTINTVQIVSMEDGYNQTFKVGKEEFKKELIPTSNDLYEIIIRYQDGEIQNRYFNAKNVYSNLIYKLGFSFETLTGGEGGMNEYFNQFLIEQDAEPKIESIVEYWREDFSQQNGGVFPKDEDKYEELETEKESVIKYGGFYIGRYEAGIDGTIKKGQTVKNNISRDDAKVLAEAMYNDSNTYGVKSTLPNGSTWDRLGQWLVSSGGKTFVDVWFSSKYWGNYSDGYKNRSVLRPTGYRESWCANHIYDLAGNIEEWTTATKKENDAPVARGSGYHVSGIPSFGSTSDVTKTEDYVYMGYRPILYLLDNN